MKTFSKVYETFAMYNNKLNQIEKAKICTIGDKITLIYFMKYCILLIKKKNIIKSNEKLILLCTIIIECFINYFLYNI